MNREQIQTMLDMQNAMNTKVHPEWRQQGFEWYRAIWVECAELLDHYGWKWWKHQEPDMEQVHLEIIDIWHFCLSLLLQQAESDDALVDDIAAAFLAPVEAGEFRLAIESFAGGVLTSQSCDVVSFNRLMVASGLDFARLYRGYVGKNVLNFFRQDHGYKDGSYRKVWSGREDNEHLVELTESLDAQSATFKDDLYAALSERYQQADAATA